ncbi:MAG: aminoglycoside adenylyltransferase domain-containing protein, partial [Gaiellaceae bacterium]
GVCDVLTNWWAPLIAKPPGWLFESPYQAYAVVTMCRVRYTLAHGDVLSKPGAARWALEHLDPIWHELIRRAAVRSGCGYDETAAFVRETLASASC